ncbi:hypothetical protein [Microbacterium album]|uniref:Uncharacterized protein n=1 Tax=Microbacterium album TaxID=2053191 RepID=A0A917IDA5_9MICO|nr:hypothetical protein [Microbacterium album]GGH34289.1 hypothetical protein GCM10010921_01880 [Microbacterium album]
MIDFFPVSLAVDPESPTVIVPNAQAEVFAASDTGFTIPLPITDLSDVPMTLVSGPTGIYPAFKVATGETQVLVRSGGLVTPMTSVLGQLLEVIPDPRAAADGDVPMVQGGEYRAVPLPTAQEMQEAMAATEEASRVAQEAARILQELVDHSGTPLVPDPDREGTFLILNPVAIAPNPAREGTFTIGGAA